MASSTIGSGSLAKVTLNRSSAVKCTLSNAAPRQARRPAVCAAMASSRLRSSGVGHLRGNGV
ncbi:hypothetical protein [Streptomyces sp. 147326]|uniref:hypothetical protein n=1 Tax=Streptomyces sp. 147326 TaxID=3074379 RepID=UPI0038572F07